MSRMRSAILMMKLGGYTSPPQCANGCTRRGFGSECFPPIRSNALYAVYAIANCWAWAYSDFLNNANRGVLAEYIVHTAISSKTKNRIEWDSCDLITKNGLKIEVKCSAYLQSWQQTAPSKLIFNIEPTKAWHFDTNTYDEAPTRSADIYVFCIFF